MNDTALHKLILNDQEIRALLETIRKSVADEKLSAFRGDLLLIKFNIEQILAEEREVTV